MCAATAPHARNARCDRSAANRTATSATIASQAMISATFSCIKRYFPRIKIIHTSKKVMGQIYIHVMNWFLMVMCIIIVATFRSTNDIANAYGELTPLGEPPSPRATHVATAVGTMVVIQGGIGPAGLSAEDLHVLNLKQQ
ncbi:Potassium transporter 23 [Zea mays]|uniref:Potassium transporter 23 n=1 Tax=Zea mays TaxID=4577 RepID=A0A3L6EVS0_MAIZE|nr:Potassium transporter 23 [Zea mays]